MRVGMTKEAYLEMCEALNSVPKESEIPVDFEDLITEVQEAVIIYNSLQDQWDYMNGNYIGKNFNYIDTVLKLYKIDSELQKFTFEILIEIDRIRSKQIQDSKPKDKTARS